jgi:transposase
MQLDLNNLPTDTELLHRLVRDIVGKIGHRDGEIERLKSIIKQLQRAQFGRRSERLDPDQLALGLEEIEGDLAREEESRPPAEKQPTERSSRHKPLPGHLAREDVRLDIDDMTCTCVYRNPKLGRSDDEVRPGWRVIECVRLAEFAERPAHLCSMIGAF